MTSDDLNGKALELKNKVTEGVLRWIEERVDSLVEDNPGLRPAGKYLKRGLSNMIRRENDKIEKSIGNLMLFIADENGNYDLDMLLDDALSMFQAMPERPFDLGLFHGTVGNGVIRVQLPDNPLVSFLMGDTGAIKITGDDIKELKSILAE